MLMNREKRGRKRRKEKRERWFDWTDILFLVSECAEYIFVFVRFLARIAGRLLKDWH